MIWGAALQADGFEPRFADPALAGKKHHLTFTGLCSCLEPRQQFKFFLPPYQLRQAAGVQGLETTFRRTHPQRRPSPHWPGDALEVLRSEVLRLEQIAEKFSRGLGDDDHVRLGEPLQACRHVRRLADDAALLRLPQSDQVADDNEPRRNANPGLQRSARLEASYRREAEMTSRRSSGSMRAESAVEPTRSENITVTWRRSAASEAGRIGAGTASASRSPEHRLAIALSNRFL